LKLNDYLRGHNKPDRPKTANGIAKDSYMIHGHIHNNTDADYFALIRLMPNLLNAGVDVNDFIPVNFNQLLKNNELFKEASKSISIKCSEE